MITLPFRLDMIDGKGEPEFIDFRKAGPEDIDEVVAREFDTCVK